MAQQSFASRAYRDDAVVLRTHKLGEADRIITLLTKRHGQVRAVAKGVRRTSSRFGARLEPFMVVDLQLISGRSLDIVTQAVAKGAYGGSIAADYGRYTVAAAMTETAEKLTDVDGEAATAQYNLLVGALAALSRDEHAAGLILDSYLLRALATGGWAPSFTDCARCGMPGPHRAFATALGGMVCPDCRPPGSPAPAAETVILLAALLTGDWPTADASLPLHRKEAAGLVAAYLQWHLERVLKSLKHVERS
ncbi:DNA repair protein RecO [Pseudarthrobacter chlorophenolicus A6]|uniref:DNA repair protein RecO n=1 Tax=Pseudarthrobacter chlorophenolicus (strain ATCC 700700 / DSM 12829 / CIP 107037 / JCM 12360 / KCTC 9906 / NCIMB 13794 / A6) TaxID=452863 RepID=B8H8Q8_PSECP|nr:DNA repair protein RecO [Pseudarthrobacter chlorophenolicus]ACL39936.1 DNA repair protein RecO [Pseudarthrobacter chlorophenolicus A6]SDQ91007.1 DNA replication and repair protein RecO [Pseudarthrobacter chlorophenolicus]